MIFKSFETTNLTVVLKAVNVNILQNHHLPYKKRYSVKFFIT